MGGCASGSARFWSAPSRGILLITPPRRTAWLISTNEKGKTKLETTSAPKRETSISRSSGIGPAHKPLHGFRTSGLGAPVFGWLQTSKLACHQVHSYRGNGGFPLGSHGVYIRANM